ncbi:sugar transferase [Clostridium tertium]|uniref:sugar transferase n=1 Tax=Clostridium tertium TaxID=1559 RepID=UPI001AE8016F|nr:sugar transferase [Clostridium tertium]MBP1868391.1 lipopolysaccharide/colanic/teichoic acid biosynthesis glycosyltransferase [Clostridium tertium]
MKKINEIIKRIFDFLASLLGIIILSPILLIVAIAIKIDSKGDILFLQKRIGKNGIPFYIYKFRTMVSDAEKLGKQITVGKDNRITKVGAFLRKYKIDELPQLFNVLKGDMSLVGPRPEVPKYVELYTELERRVLEVRPGITDLASLRYKDENDILGKVDNPEEYYINVIMKDKLKLNLEYIEKSNLIFDISLIFKTIIKCL